MARSKTPWLVAREALLALAGRPLIAHVVYCFGVGGLENGMRVIM